MYLGNICIVLDITKWQLEYGLIWYLLNGAKLLCLNNKSVVSLHWVSIQRVILLLVKM